MQEPTSQLTVRKHDLDDPNLYRLNEILKFITSQINAIRENGHFSGTLDADKITAQLYDKEPGPNDVVPWGTIKRLLSPSSVRQAFITNNWLGTPVRPLTGLDIPAGGVISAIVDTHANRIGRYYPTGYDVGSLYYETDRNSLYQIQIPGGVKTWAWISGLMIDVLASRPSDLSTYDEGFNYLSTDTDAAYSYRWNGASWGVVNLFAEDGSLFTYDNSANSTLTFGRSEGTVAIPADAVTADVVADLIFQARRDGAFVGVAQITVDIESTPSASTAAGRISLQTSDSTGSALTTRWQLTSDGNIVPFVDNTYSIGSASESAAFVWTTGLNVKQGGTAGDVLTNDGSDNAVWAAGGGGDVNTYKSANASASDTLTTSFANLSGCSYNLDKDGDWLVIGNFQFYKDINDDECQGQLLYNGTPQSGIVRFGAATTNSVRGMATRSWVVTVSGQPKSITLQAKKNAGTGTSTSDITNTNLTAVFLKA